MLIRLSGPDETVENRKKKLMNVFFVESEQVYTRMKHAETWYKGLGRTRNELSCVAPELYCERFINFMAEHTR